MRAIVRWHPVLMITAGLMLVLSLVHAAGVVLDDTMYGQTPNWMKPLKFSVSFTLYAAMLGGLVHLLESASGSVERKVRVLGTWIAAALWYEIFFLDLQALRGTQVHFNFRSLFDAVIYESVGAVAMATVVLHVLLVAVVLRKRAARPPVLLALKLGTALLVASALVGVLMAFPLNGEGWSGDAVGGHFIGTDVDHDVVPGIYWSSEGGDLRVAHFIGLHAFQVLPLTALLFARWVDSRMVWVLSAGYTAVFAISLVQALAGESLFAPSPPTVAAAAATLAATAAGAVWAHRTRPTPPVPPESGHRSDPTPTHL